MLKDQIKKQWLSMGERAGQSLLKSAENKGAAIGERIQNVLGEQVEKVYDALEKETVTKTEQLGVGGKLGTGIGVIGKQLAEKRYGVLGTLMGSDNLVAEGRIIGAKAEKIIRRAAKTGVQRIARRRVASKE